MVQFIFATFRLHASIKNSFIRNLIICYSSENMMKITTLDEFSLKLIDVEISIHIIILIQISN